MEHKTFAPKGVCSVQIDFDIDENKKLHNVKFVGGCNGNLKAIGKLVEGKDAAEIADILRAGLVMFVADTRRDQKDHAHDDRDQQRIGRV